MMEAEAAALIDRFHDSVTDEGVVGVPMFGLYPSAFVVACGGSLRTTKVVRLNSEAVIALGETGDIIGVQIDVDEQLAAGLEVLHRDPNVKVRS